MICIRAVSGNCHLNSIFRRFSLSSDLRVSSNLQQGVNVNSNSSAAYVENAKSGRLSLRSRYLSFLQARIMSSSEASGEAEARKTNRLSLEKSPYLLQHATNPVHWYPWGQEAFEKAQRENKIIFLSVGYSTCHWCHVMEKESFENESVAEIMNEHYVCVKVDREERPDVDRMYMSFVQRTTGGGGWPMSVFLTPDLEPLFGGTYFPPEDKYGRVGFKTLLTLIAKQWGEQHAILNSEAKSSVSALKRLSRHKFVTSDNISVPSEDAARKCLQQFSRAYEKKYGGFSSAPKFPQPSIFNFLFHMYSRDKASEQGKLCLDMCLYTLKKMAYGGMHDHVNTGFARYSVDEKWHVPHFEKMLYDQSQLVVSYCDAYVLTKDEFYADVVRDILNYVSRDLSHELGGFYGAEDADSYPYEGARHKQEGAFCVWEYDEVNNLLDEQTDDILHSDLFCFHYNVKENGNVNPDHDPHNELKNKNVLACFGSYEETAEKYDVSVKKVKEILEKCHRVLYEVRQQRPKPHVDTKIVTSWNGLMISGYAKAGFALKDQSYTNRAAQAANFIKRFLYDEENKTLLRCCYRGDDGNIAQTATPIVGFLDDYAFLIRGLLDLYEASLDSNWLQWAEVLQEQQNRLFWDGDCSGFFTTPEGDTSILIRDKEDQDGAEPCGNSVAVHNLIRLAAYLDRQDLRDKAGRTLTAFSERLREIPFALPEMTSALMFYNESPPQVFIAGSSEDNNTQALLDVVRTHFLPGRLLAIADGPTGRSSLLYTRHESLSKLKPIQGKSAAYVCRNFVCSLPVTEPDALAVSLESEGDAKTPGGENI